MKIKSECTKTPRIELQDILSSRTPQEPKNDHVPCVKQEKEQSSLNKLFKEPLDL